MQTYDCLARREVGIGRVAYHHIAEDLRLRPYTLDRVGGWQIVE